MAADASVNFPITDLQRQDGSPLCGEVLQVLCQCRELDSIPPVRKDSTQTAEEARKAQHSVFRLQLPNTLALKTCLQKMGICFHQFLKKSTTSSDRFNKQHTVVYKNMVETN